MKAIASALMLLASFVLGGCSTQASLALNSQPEGAYIIEKGSKKSFSVTPVTIYYDAKEITKIKDRDGCFRLNGFVARWGSGAIASTTDEIKFCGLSNGSYSWIFTRDPSSPGLDQDLNFAMQMRQERAAKQAEDRAANAGT